MLFIFLALKFVAYCGVFVLAIPMLRLPVANKTSFAISWAGIRFLVGLLVGLAIAWLFGIAQNSKLPEFVSYSLSFVFVRYLAWLLMLGVIAKQYGLGWRFRDQYWVSVGVAANVALDGFAVATGVSEVRLFC